MQSRLCNLMFWKHLGVFWEHLGVFCRHFGGKLGRHTSAGWSPGGRRVAAGWPDTVWGRCLAGWGAAGRDKPRKTNEIQNLQPGCEIFPQTSLARRGSYLLCSASSPQPAKQRPQTGTCHPRAIRGPSAGRCPGHLVPILAAKTHKNAA